MTKKITKKYNGRHQKDSKRKSKLPQAGFQKRRGVAYSRVMSKTKKGTTEGPWNRKKSRVASSNVPLARGFQGTWIFVWSRCWRQNSLAHAKLSRDLFFEIHFRTKFSWALSFVFGFIWVDGNHFVWSGLAWVCPFDLNSHDWLPQVHHTSLLGKAEWIWTLHLWCYDPS